ncbi:hypothetical protein [Chromobacterium paludis]|uniref:Uncharacterized protein n=1 Tax=Chromobacterium paludis TaxID=2605945 RepID=A0A5C1DI22_9NEIS|nr:hypothetical protein [Chromobacterium paludis]QEL56371.1 hypothetical protein FYK34_12785 [Chromobacterium paludis]
MYGAGFDIRAIIASPKAKPPISCAPFIERAKSSVTIAGPLPATARQRKWRSVISADGIREPGVILLLPGGAGIGDARMSSAGVT